MVLVGFNRPINQWIILLQILRFSVGSSPFLSFISKKTPNIFLPIRRTPDPFFYQEPMTLIQIHKTPFGLEIGVGLWRFLLWFSLGRSGKALTKKNFSTTGKKNSSGSQTLSDAVHRFLHRIHTEAPTAFSRVSWRRSPKNIKNRIWQRDIHTNHKIPASVRI